MKTAYVRKLIRELPPPGDTKASQRRRRVELKRLYDLLAIALRRDAWRAARDAERRFMFRYDAASAAWVTLIDAENSHAAKKRAFDQMAATPSSNPHAAVPRPPQRPRPLAELVPLQDALEKATDWFAQARESLKSATEALKDAADSIPEHKRLVCPGIRGLAGAVRTRTRVPGRTPSKEDGFEHTLVRQFVNWAEVLPRLDGSIKASVSPLPRSRTMERAKRSLPLYPLRRLLERAVHARFADATAEAAGSAGHIQHLAIGRYLLLRKQGTDPLALRRLLRMAFPSLSGYESIGFIMSRQEPAFLTPVLDETETPFPEQPVRYRYKDTEGDGQGWLYVFPVNARNPRPRGLHVPDGEGASSAGLRNITAAWVEGVATSVIEREKRERKRLNNWWACRNEDFTWQDSRKAGNCVPGTANFLRQLGLASSRDCLTDDTPPAPIKVRTLFKAARRAKSERYSLLLSALEQVARRTGH